MSKLTLKLDRNDFKHKFHKSVQIVNYLRITKQILDKYRDSDIFKQF